MSDEAIIVKDLGYVYLGGPPLVKAATGEIVSDKELGGAEVHCELSGCTDHYADDEQDALEIARSIGETLPLWKKGRNDYDDDDDDDDDDEQKIQPLHSMEDISNLIPCSGSKQPLPIRQILARLLDKSEFHEHLFGSSFEDLLDVYSVFWFFLPQAKRSIYNILVVRVV